MSQIKFIIKLFFEKYSLYFKLICIFVIVVVLYTAYNFDSFISTVNEKKNSPNIMNYAKGVVFKKTYDNHRGLEISSDFVTYSKNKVYNLSDVSAKYTDKSDIVEFFSASAVLSLKKNSVDLHGDVTLRFNDAMIKSEVMHLDLTEYKIYGKKSSLFKYQEYSITSDNFYVDYKNNLVSFTGNVHANISFIE